jgi:hypothetical protein
MRQHPFGLLGLAGMMIFGLAVGLTTNIGISAGDGGAIAYAAVEPHPIGPYRLQSPAIDCTDAHLKIGADKVEFICSKTVLHGMTITQPLSGGHQLVMKTSQTATATSVIITTTLPYLLATSKSVPVTALPILLAGGTVKQMTLSNVDLRYTKMEAGSIDTPGLTVQVS